MLQRVNEARHGALLLFACEWKNREDWNPALEALARIDLKAINNSVVGTSKFLHFVAPEIFPIWDSRIAAVFGFRHDYQINNALNYRKYCDAIHDRLARPIDWPILLANDETLSRKTTNVRKLEFCLFARGKALATISTAVV
jgi:hypothetical protein